MPRVTSAEEPSGARSQSRTARSALGLSTASSSRTSGKPRISSGSSSGSESKVRKCVVRALVGGQSADCPSAHQTPASVHVGLEAEELARLGEQELPDARADVR